MLLRALVEAEIDGVAVANQLTALKGTIESLAKVGPNQGSLPGRSYRMKHVFDYNGSKKECLQQFFCIFFLYFLTKGNQW